MRVPYVWRTANISCCCCCCIAYAWISQVAHSGEELMWVYTIYCYFFMYLFMLCFFFLLLSLLLLLEVGSPKVLLLCRSWGACVPRRSQRLCQLEFWLLVGTTMLDRLWARGQTKCNTLLMLATSVFGRILLTTLLCDVLSCEVESLAGCVGG